MKLNESIITDIQSIINRSRESAIRAVDRETVIMYGNIGKIIFVEEQHGANRTEYGTQLIRTTSTTIWPGFFCAQP